MLRVVIESIGVYINGGSPDTVMTIFLAVGLLVLACIGFASTWLSIFAWHAAGRPGGVDFESCVLYPGWCCGSLWLFTAALSGYWVSCGVLFGGIFLVLLWLDAISYNLGHNP